MQVRSRTRTPGNNTRKAGKRRGRTSGSYHNQGHNDRQVTTRVACALWVGASGAITVGARANIHWRAAEARPEFPPAQVAQCQFLHRSSNAGCMGKRRSVRLRHILISRRSKNVHRRSRHRRDPTARRSMRRCMSVQRQLAHQENILDGGIDC